jgi:hypothetical protein
MVRPKMLVQHEGDGSEPVAVTPPAPPRDYLGEAYSAMLKDEPVTDETAPTHEAVKRECPCRKTGGCHRVYYGTVPYVHPVAAPGRMSASITPTGSTGTVPVQRVAQPPVIARVAGGARW